MAEITATHHHDDIASSSTASGSASTPPYVHFDIFVNHFEDETRDFAMELCKRLVSHGFYVFLDGIDKEVTPRVEAAISVAALQIAIFSPIYATCKWCLDTLVQMTNSEAAILPVFYGVEPFHLRYTGKDDKGPYAQSLRAHEEKGRYDSKIIEAWRDALWDVSNISGFQLEDSNGGQEVLLGKVVDSVFKTCPLPYHVFLSHRGTDTKEKFAQPLYDRLVSHGLRVFLDKPELVGAVKIETQIELPIQFASVNIVIFSPRFPESSSCMDELFLITKATGTILPVFYEVEPSDLDGIYIETLYSHHREKQRQDTGTIEKWRDALANVPKSDEFMLAGEELKEDLMDKIVERVRKYIPKPLEFMISSEEQRAWKSALKDVPKRSQAVPVKDTYVGLHEKLEDFEKAVPSQQNYKLRRA